MPNVSEKKKKLLCLLQILLSETDSEHTITLPEILQRLESMGIPAERKSIYDDIETLRSAGVMIGTRKRKTYQYFVERRTFSVEDLQMIAGAIRSAPFIPQEQAEKLLSKLGILCSSHQVEELSREIFAVEESGPAKNCVFSTVQLLCRAISENRKVQFILRKWQLTPQGKPAYTAEAKAKPVSVSPWKILTERGHCELLGSTEEGTAMRVPLAALEGLELLSEERQAISEASEAAEQGKKAEKIILEFSSEQLSAVAERFGSNITVESAGKNKLRAALKIENSSGLFDWLFSHGPEIRLTAPKKLVEQFRERTKSLAKLYKS